MTVPVDLKLQPYRPGQKIIKGHSLGTTVWLTEREIAEVTPEGSVYMTPHGGAKIPERLRRPELAYILKD